MIDFNDINKFKSYKERVLYRSWVRSTLNGIDLKNSTLMEIWVDMQWAYSYAKNMFDVCEDCDKAKSITYACALLLSYIPYGAVGEKYVAETLKEKELWQFRYETSLNTLARDNIFFNDEEKGELKALFQAVCGNVYKNDFVGFVAIVYKVYLACYLLGNKRGYSEKLQDIYGAFESGAVEIDISAYLPVVAETELDEEKKEEIQNILSLQKNAPVHIKALDRETFVSVICKKTVALSFADVGEDCAVGDELKFTWDNLVLTAKVTQVYADENGEMVAEFEAEDVAQVNYGYYHLEYDKAELGEIQKGEKFTLILKNKKLYRTVGFYEEFLLTEKTSGEKMLVGGFYGSKTVYSKDELLENLKRDIPSSISIATIEQDGITEEEYENGLVLFPVGCKEKE